MARSLTNTLFHCHYPIIYREYDGDVLKYMYKDIYWQYRADSMISREKLYKLYPFAMCMRYGYDYQIFKDYKISKTLMAKNIVSFVKKYAPSLLEKLKIDVVNITNPHDIMEQLRYKYPNCRRILKDNIIVIKNTSSYFNKLNVNVIKHVREDFRKALTNTYKRIIDQANTTYNDSYHKIKDIECYTFNASNKLIYDSDIVIDVFNGLAQESFAFNFSYYDSFANHFNNNKMYEHVFLKMLLDLYYYDGILVDSIIDPSIKDCNISFEPVRYSIFVQYLTGNFITAIQATIDTNKKILYFYNKSCVSPNEIFDDEYYKFTYAHYNLLKYRYYSKKLDDDDSSIKVSGYPILSKDTITFNKGNFCEGMRTVCTDRSTHYRNQLCKLFSSIKGIRGQFESPTQEDLILRNIKVIDMLSLILTTMQKKAILDRNRYYSRLYDWEMKVCSNVKIVVHSIHASMNAIEVHRYRNLVDKDGRICFKLAIGIAFYIIDTIALTKPIHKLELQLYASVKIADNIEDTEVIFHVNDMHEVVDNETDNAQAYYNDMYNVNENIVWRAEEFYNNFDDIELIPDTPNKESPYRIIYSDNKIYLNISEEFANKIIHDKGFQHAIVESLREFLSGIYDKIHYMLLTIDHFYRKVHQISNEGHVDEINYNGDIRKFMIEASYYYDDKVFGPHINRLFRYHHNDGTLIFGDEINE